LSLLPTCKLELHFITTIFRMTVTEVACVAIKPGLDVMNPTTPEGQVLLRAWKPVTAAPGGPHHLYYGVEIEDPSKLWAVCDWDSIEDHLNFAKSCVTRFSQLSMSLIS
jgi:hypothetical protein